MLLHLQYIRSSSNQRNSSESRIGWIVHQDMLLLLTLYPWLPSQITEELYVIISLRQLPLQRDDLQLEFIDQLGLRVLILDGLVADKAGLRRVGQGRQVLLEVGVRGRETRDHQTEGVTPD